MKRIIAAILCLSMMMALSGCSDINNVDWDEVQSELIAYAKETGEKLLSDAKVWLQQKFTETVENIRAELPTWLGGTGDDVSELKVVPEHYGAKNSWGTKKQTLQAYIEENYGSGVTWYNMDRNTQRECVRGYFGDIIYTTSKNNLQKEVKAFLKAESDASGAEDDYRLDTLAKKLDGKEKLRHAWETLHEESDYLGTYITPQVCAGFELLGDKYVPAIGVFLTTVSFAGDAADMLLTDPKEMDPEEVLDKLVNLTTSAMNYNALLMWMYDIPLKMAVKLAKEVIQNAEQYFYGLDFYALYGISKTVNLETHIDVERWGCLPDVERVKRGEGPTSIETVQVLAELMSKSADNPEITQELLHQMTDYLKWRIVFEVKEELKAQNYSDKEAEKVLETVCDEMKAWHW